VAGLLLALIDFPDFGTSLKRIAGSAEKVAGLKPGEGLTDLPGESVIDAKETEAPETDYGVGHGDGAAVARARPAPAKRKELGHA
jgi:hypothetical protein